MNFNMTNRDILPCVNELNRLFSYEESSGKLYWKVRLSNCVRIGDEAGNIEGRYRRVKFGKYKLLVHRIIWKIKTWSEPPEYVDHKDTNGLNNRWTNLREATQSQNIANSLLSIANESGFKGVSFDKRANKWRARIMINYKDILIGYYSTKEQAALARKQYALAKHAEYAREF